MATATSDLQILTLDENCPTPTNTKRLGLETAHMKAIVYPSYGSPDVLRVADVAKPSPRDNEVLIRIRAAAVTTTDVNLRGGDKLMRLVFGLRKPKRPILGTEFAGEIEAVGKDVTRFKPGDQIFAATGAGFGAHAEYICLPEDGALAPKPANATFEEAAAICEGGMTALPFLRDTGKIRPGHTVLINGASGAVGSAAVQLAKHFGADVTAVCGPTNAEMVKSLGADSVIDYSREDFTRNGQTYDIIFDAVGKRSFSECKGSLKPGGVYMATVPSLALYAHVLWTTKFGNKKARVAATGLRSPGEKAKDLLVLKALVEAGELRPIIDAGYSMDRVAEAHRHVETGHKKGHVVMTLDSSETTRH
jgi:NADPH:quinone reductase-like Zn-dependent oxidoreductase